MKVEGIDYAGRTRKTYFKVTMYTLPDDPTDPEEFSSEIANMLTDGCRHPDLMPGTTPLFEAEVMSTDSYRADRGFRIEALWAVKFPEAVSTIDWMIVSGSPNYVADQVSLDSVHSVWSTRTAAVAQARELLRELAERISEEADKEV